MQRNVEDQKRNSRRAWVRWVVASVVGGVVSTSLVFVAPVYLAEIVVQPQQPLDLSFAKALIYFFCGGVLVSGPVGALAHWLLMGRPAIDVGRWITKWSMGCWLGLIGVLVVAFLVTNVNVEPIERFVDIIGVWTAFTLANAVFGLIISAVLKDTRPDRVRRAPGP